jgi:hypothetical protein
MGGKEVVMNAQGIFAGIASLGAIVLLANMARTEQAKEQLVLIAVIVIGVVLALGFGFLRKGSSGGG